ncbi:uncharacterized protein LOC128724666 [Anopheles nili]|uniref:uncharacterized protein LOC128724666 n=1 Tax=Anopheles nili TaxID=185578 RepID=UPI00237B93B5|nr:uncharacterized protein LOC128724666 [Anopheles nili]
MHPPVLERALTVLMMVAFVRFPLHSVAILDFNFDDDPKSDYQLCCMVEHSFPREPFDACYAKHQTPEMENDTVICLEQCYYEAIGMFTDGGKLQADKYRAYRDSLEPALQKPFTHAMTFCAAFISKALRLLGNRVKQFKCSPVPYFYNRCLSEVDVVNCPKDRWMNSSMCDKLIEVMKQKYGKGVQMKAVNTREGNTMKGLDCLSNESDSTVVEVTLEYYY